MNRHALLALEDDRVSTNYWENKRTSIKLPYHPGTINQTGTSTKSPHSHFSEVCRNTSKFWITNQKIRGMACCGSPEAVLFQAGLWNKAAHTSSSPGTELPDDVIAQSGLYCASFTLAVHWMLFTSTSHLPLLQLSCWSHGSVVLLEGQRLSRGFK